MAIIAAEDHKNSLLMALSGVNVAALGGLTDAIVAANSTVTALQTAIEALPALAGTSPDGMRQASRGIRFGVNAGAIPETHGVTTVAGLRGLLTANLPGVDPLYTGALPQ
jgi:hypothetical protein